MQKMKFKIKSKRKLRPIKATTKNKRVHNRAMVLLLVSNGKSVAEIARFEILSESAVKNVVGNKEGGL